MLPALPEVYPPLALTPANQLANVFECLRNDLSGGVIIGAHI